MLLLLCIFFVKETIDILPVGRLCQVWIGAIISHFFTFKILYIKSIWRWTSLTLNPNWHLYSSQLIVSFPSGLWLVHWRSTSSFTYLGKCHFHSSFSTILSMTIGHSLSSQPLIKPGLGELYPLGQLIHTDNAVGIRINPVWQFYQIALRSPNSPVHYHPKSSLTFLWWKIVKFCGLVFTKECLVVVVMVEVIMMLEIHIFSFASRCNNWIHHSPPPCQRVVFREGHDHALSHAPVLARTEPEIDIKQYNIRLKMKLLIFQVYYLTGKL